MQTSCNRRLFGLLCALLASVVAPGFLQRERRFHVIPNRLGTLGTAMEPGHVVLAGSFTRVVFPKKGDTLHAETEVLAARLSKSRPNQGIVTFEHRGYNQHDTLTVKAVRDALMSVNPAG